MHGPGRTFPDSGGGHGWSSTGLRLSSWEDDDQCRGRVSWPGSCVQGKEDRPGPCTLCVQDKYGHLSQGMNTHSPHTHTHTQNLQFYSLEPGPCLESLLSCRDGCGHACGCSEPHISRAGAVGQEPGKAKYS